MVEKVADADVTQTDQTKIDDTTVVGTTDEDLKAVENVKERLSFFFSDANVRQDLFIRKLLTKTDEKSVPVDALLRFNTIKSHTFKPAVVIQAAKELTELLVVDEVKSVISRVIPFTDEMMNQNILKSLYIKNLPMKETGGDRKSKHYDVNVGELRAIFGKYGDVALAKFKFSAVAEDSASNNWDHRNKRAKRPKFPIGAGVIEFHKQKDLEIAAEATLTIKNGDKIDPKEKAILAESQTRKSAIVLEVMLLSEYVESRKGMKVKKPSDSNNNNKKRHELEEEKESAKFTFDWKPGCVIKVYGMPEGCDREAILDAVSKGLGISIEDVKGRKIYVDYSRGQADGAIRFPEQSDSIVEISKQLNDGELTIMDTKVNNSVVLMGEEEKKYWNAFIEFKNKQIMLRHDEKSSRGKRQKRG